LIRQPQGTRDFTDEEIARRRDAVIKHMLNTPPKLHKEMKIGKRKEKAGTKANPKKRELPKKASPT
jgi:hypothetical protein